MFSMIVVFTFTHNIFAIFEIINSFSSFHLPTGSLSVLCAGTSSTVNMTLTCTLTSIDAAVWLDDSCIIVYDRLQQVFGKLNCEDRGGCFSHQMFFSLLYLAV